MDSDEVLALTWGLPVGSCIETDEAMIIVGPTSVSVTPTDPYGERYELIRNYAAA